MNFLKIFRVHPGIVVISLIAAILLIFSANTVFTAVDAEKDVVNATKKRLEILKLSEEFNRSIGYGGFIHNFKNYILRQDEQYFDAARKNITKSLDLLLKLEKNAAATVEIAGLQKTRTTLLSYINNLSLAQELTSQGLSPTEIDKRVLIDDETAISGINLTVGLIRERLDQEINTLDTEVAEARSRLALLIFLFAATILGTLGLLYYATKVAAREIKLKSLIDADKATLQQSYDAEILGNVGHWLYTLETDELEWSGGVFAIHDLEPSAATPSFKETLTYFHPEDRAFANTALNQAIKNKEPFDFTKRIITAKGKQRTVQIKGKSTRAQDNLYLFGVIQDITAQVKREAELKQITERFELARNSVKMGIWEINLKTHALTWDDSMFTLYGIDRARFSGSFNDWISRVHPDDVISTRNAFQAATDNGGNFNTTYRICLPDSSIIWINSGAETLMDDAGIPERLIGISLDVTEAKTAEIMIQTALADAEKASAAKSDFLAVMSHEIRTPLNGLLGMLQLLSQKKLDTDSHYLIETARSSGYNLLNVLTDVLEMSRIEAGKLELNPAPFNVARMLQQTLNLHEPLATEKGLRVNYVIPEDSPPVLIGDEPRIRQILGNYLSNAIKFSSNGSVTMSCTLTESDNGKYVDLHTAVIDQGIGIPETKLQNLFKPFEQIDSSRTRTYGGTGLGLSICKQLAEAMGGKVGVQSIFGNGSRFWVEIRLPIGSVEEQLDRFSVKAGDLPSLRILAAEDVSVNQIVLDKMLRETLEQDLTIVDNGVQALEALKHETFDVILMDVQMPEMDGVQATKLIRASDEAYADIPIIGITANALKAQQEEYIAVGMNYCVTKPVDWGELIRVMNILTGKRKIANTKAAAPNTTQKTHPKPIRIKSNEDILDEIHKMLGPDKFPALMKELSQEFEKQLILMKSEPANSEILMLCTHTLRGICAYYDLYNILSIVREIENENRNPIKIISLLEKLEQEIDDLLQLSRFTIGV